MGDDRLELILATFRERGGRMTTPRRAIVTALLDADGHPTADDLAEAVQHAHPDIHRSTVYRTLDTLTELAVVSHVHLGHGPARYHLADEAHHYLVCDGCGTVVELPGDVFDAVGRRIRRDHGFRLDARHFALGGLCRACDSRATTTEDRMTDETHQADQPDHDHTGPHAHEHAHGDLRHSHPHDDHEHEHVEHVHEHDHADGAHEHAHVHQAGLEDEHDDHPG